LQPQISAIAYPGLVIRENKQESGGRETNFFVTRCYYIFFVDKVGCNTLQKSEGNAGRQKFVVVKKKALIGSSH